MPSPPLRRCAVFVGCLVAWLASSPRAFANLCYTPDSVGTGGTCYVDDACSQGKCSSIDGTKGTCVCKNDPDCGTGKWCDAGLDVKSNVCRNKLDAGQSCGSRATFGNDHKCKSGRCSGFPNYKCK